MSLDLCLPFFFFKPAQFIGHSARIQCYRGAGILAGAPGGDSSSTGQPPLWTALDPTIAHLAPDPLEGVGTGHLQSSFLSPHLSLLPISAEEGFSKPV